MHIALSPETIALREELRAYLSELMTPTLQAELDAADAGAGGPEYDKAIRRLGADNWLGFGWPTEYGGQGRSAVEQSVFFDEFQRISFPFPILTLCSVGPTIMKFGTEAQKQEYLPAILRGELNIAIGYTEPSAGTDLAGLRTRAELQGEQYVVNGQKVFTSHAAHADYIWLAARTDPSGPKHGGISMLMVKRDSPGIEIQPIHTLGRNDTYSVYFTDVKVPRENLVGEENGGWRIVTTQLNFERVAIAAPGHAVYLYERALAWAKETPAAEGGSLLDQPWVRQNFAEIHADLAVLRLMNWKQAVDIDRRKLSPADASALKVYSSEGFVRIYRRFMEIFGRAGTLQLGSPGAVLQARAERFYRALIVFTFGGGTNEIQRDIICMMGLGMPRGVYGESA